MFDGDRERLSAPAFDEYAFRDCCHLVVASFHIEVRADDFQDPKRHILGENRHKSDALKRRDDGGAVVFIVNWTVVTLTQASYRGVTIDGDHERHAERSRSCQIGHMAAMQNVKNAVRENKRPCQELNAMCKRTACDNLVLESGAGISVMPTTMIVRHHEQRPGLQEPYRGDGMQRR